MAYNDLRQHLQALEQKGLLVRVKRSINKDTELHPLVRWQYRGGLKDEQRRAFLFENVTDSRGRQYNSSVTVGALAGSKEVYTTGLQCKLEDIPNIWERALNHPIKPEIVDSGPVHEEIHQGEDLYKDGGGLEEFPIPISTPGWDNAPYTTCSHWLTRDMETRVQNIGNYRGMVKARDKIGLYPMTGQHIHLHIEKVKKAGKPLEAALIIGAPPAVSYTAVSKIPAGVDEITVAGGLVGEPIRLVHCKTVDLHVPAEAEIVIEGLISTEYLEPEGPFGESHGYMHPRQYNYFMEVKCITHRKDAIWTSFISQVTPSESSIIKRLGYEPMFYNYLHNTLSIRSVKRVVMHEPLTNLRKLIIIQMDRPNVTEVWRALHSAATFHHGVGKIIIAVDSDIDPENLDAVMWAASYRMKPHKDVQIVSGMDKGHGPPFAGISDSEDIASYHGTGNDSALLINAILKEPFPPISLPKKEYMERAKVIWEELGLPELEPCEPWYGYSLGQWDEELEEEARLAVEGEYFLTGQKLNERKRKI
jgi:4-hydroxy-3-polyprenylbenzoate decarboxylase